MQKKEEVLGGQMLHTGSCKKESQSLQMIVVKKEREEEYDQEIVRQWKEARRHFFKHTIKQKLSQCKVPQKHQMEIVKGFMEANENKNYFIDLKEYGQISEYKQQMNELNQSFRSINQQFSQRQKETPMIAQIIRLKLTELRVISIQYSLNIHQQQRYEISAFELFKVVHENRKISSVTLKGVKVKYFSEFIKAMKKPKSNQQKEQQNKEWSWMKDFKPSNLLKMVIDSKDSSLCFTIDEDLRAIKELAQFGGLFSQLSVISIKIPLEYLLRLQQLLGSTVYALRQLRDQLAKMERIKIKAILEGRGLIAYPGELFSLLLQMLSSLNTVAQLQLRNIKLNSNITINRFLAMEQMLSTIFENNTVTHLQLNNCINFPILPSITTLQKLSLWNISFRRQFSFMSELAQSSPCLQSIKYAYMKQEWRIEEQLLNQLQSLTIQQSRNVSLGVLTHSPSNIKRLAIYKSNFDGLPTLLPKLANITQLVLSSIDFGHQLLYTIPSPHLATLIILKNNLFANQGLEAIDKKWPKLRWLVLQNCPNLNESAWSVCKFKGLIRLSIGTKIQTLGHSIQQQLRRRGIVLQ